MKLNLGCGNNLEDGFVNVDWKDPADKVVNLQQFPWPFENDSVEEVRCIHTLEHLGGSPEQRIGILRELFRVCKHGTKILIVVPHPRHDHFINDPTHVWAVTPAGLELFDQEKNREWTEKGFSNSTLGLDHGIDLRMVRFREIADPAWEKARTSDFRGFSYAKRHYNNVIQAYEIELEARKR